MTDDEKRIKALELVTAAVIAGRVHPYDAPGLAQDYFRVLSGQPPQHGDDEAEEVSIPRRTH
jgi:hypothetical protein